MFDHFLCTALFCERVFNFQFNEEDLKDKLKKYDLEIEIQMSNQTDIYIDLENFEITVTHTY